MNLFRSLPSDCDVMVVSNSKSCSSSSRRSDLMEPTQPPPPPSSETKPFSPSSSSLTPKHRPKQSTMHDFPSFPVLKTWGTRRVLRCFKLEKTGQTNTIASGSVCDQGVEQDNRKRKDAGGFDQIQAVQSFGFTQQTGKIELLVPEKDEPKGAEREIPWSLRTRRGSCTRLTDSENPNSEGRWPRLRSEDFVVRNDELLRRKRPTFSLVLTTDEIEEDLYSITGTRASRRPKKRPRTLKKQLDQIFPGFYLSEVTPELYQVREPTALPPVGS